MECTSEFQTGALTGLRPSNPLGVKGAGEGAIIPVGGLMANAVANAWPREEPCRTNCRSRPRGSGSWARSRNLSVARRSRARRYSLNRRRGAGLFRRGRGSHGRGWIRRRRKEDSNRRSPLREGCFGTATPPGWDRLEPHLRQRGTKGSNPLSSCGESVLNSDEELLETWTHNTDGEGRRPNCEVRGLCPGCQPL